MTTLPDELRSLAEEIRHEYPISADNLGLAAARLEILEELVPWARRAAAVIRDLEAYRDWDYDESLALMPWAEMMQGPDEPSEIASPAERDLRKVVPAGVMQLTPAELELLLDAHEDAGHDAFVPEYHSGAGPYCAVCGNNRDVHPDNAALDALAKARRGPVILREQT